MRGARFVAGAIQANAQIRAATMAGFAPAGLAVDGPFPSAVVTMACHNSASKIEAIAPIANGKNRPIRFAQCNSKIFAKKDFYLCDIAHSALKSAKARGGSFAKYLMKPSPKNIASMEAENLLGDFHPLVEQLGSADGLKMAGEVNASLRLDHVEDLAGLKNFLQSYRDQILAPIELPLICQAYAHASRNEFSELISLDQKIARESRLALFSAASKRVGQIQLQRLRPLRDQRGLQRYIRAVDAEEANAWHTLVYGITLASFSFPLRQGLQNYAHQTLSGFVRSSRNAERFGQNECENVLEEITAAIPAIIDALLANPFSIANAAQAR